MLNLTIKIMSSCGCESKKVTFKDEPKKQQTNEKNNNGVNPTVAKKTKRGDKRTIEQPNQTKKT